MWRWQLKSSPSKKHRAWSRLFLLSLSAHLVFVFVMLFIYKGSSYHIDLTFNPRNLAHATIVFMPLHKKVARPAFSGNSGKTQPTAQKETSTPQTKTVDSTISIQEKTTSAKISPPATRLATTAAVPVAKTKKILRTSAFARKASADTRPALRSFSVVGDERVIKNAKKNKLLAEKKVEKTVETQPPINTQKKAAEKEKTIDIEPKPLQEKVQSTLSSTAQTIAATATTNTATPTTDQNIIYAGQEDLDALKLQQVIQQEIATHFKPPAGLSRQLQCQLTLTVAFDGTIMDVAVHQSSGAAIFDMSARNAVRKLNLPAWTHGKELTITFNN